MTAATAHRRRKLLPYAAALVGFSTLGACTGSDPGPVATAPAVTSSSASPSTTAPPSTTAKPTPTATVDPVVAKIPAAARRLDDPGAMAFARFFIESLNVGATTANPAVLEGLFVPSCKTCAAMHESLGDLKRNGERHKGRSIRVMGTTTLSSSSGGTRQVLIDVQQISVAVVDADGKTVRTTAQGPGSFVMTLRTSNGHWMATRLQTAS